MEFVEGLLLLGHRLVMLPGFRDHHHQGVGQRAAGEVQQLQYVVQDGRVGAFGIDDRQRLAQFVAEQLGTEMRLTGVHPVHVAAQSVDLAVVRDVAVRMGPRPGGESVGGEARVDHRDGALDALIGQVRIEHPQLRGVEHALVNDGPAAERRDVEVAARRDRRARYGLLDEPADDIEFALERHVLDQAGRPIDEDLANQRLGGFGTRAQARVLCRDVAPAQEMQTFVRDHLLEQAEAFDAADLVLREEDHAHAVAALASQVDAGLGGHVGEEAVGDLDRQAGAVTGVLLRAGCAAVLKVDQDGQGVTNDRMRRAAGDVHDKAEAARIVLELGGV